MYLALKLNTYSLSQDPDSRDRVATRLEEFVSSSGWETTVVASEDEALQNERIRGHHDERGDLGVRTILSPEVYRVGCRLS